MKFVHAADIHLDSPVRVPSPAAAALHDVARTAGRTALSNLVTLCIVEGARFLVLAGDTFDASVRDYKAALFFETQMLRLRQAGIAVFAIGGNHDAASWLTPSLLLPDNVVVFGRDAAKTCVLFDAGVAIHGQSYADRAVSANLAARYPEPLADMLNIGILHTSAEGREGHARYAPCNRRTLRARGYDYWALGHVHAREILGVAPWIVFPGNIQGRSLREPGAKGATVVTVGNGSVTSVEHRALDVVRFTTCAIEADADARIVDVVDRARAALVDLWRDEPGRASVVRVVISNGQSLRVPLCPAPAHSSSKASERIRRAPSEIVGDTSNERLVVEGVWQESTFVDEGPWRALSPWVQ